MPCRKLGRLTVGPETPVGRAKYGQGFNLNVQLGTEGQVR